MLDVSDGPPLWALRPPRGPRDVRGLPHHGQPHLGGLHLPQRHQGPHHSQGAPLQLFIASTMSGILGTFANASQNCYKVVMLFHD